MSDSKIRETAATLLNLYGEIENFPSNLLGEQRKLATLRTDAPLFKKVETWRWHGPTRHSRPGRSGQKRRGCWSVATKLRASDGNRV